MKKTDKNKNENTEVNKNHEKKELDEKSNISLFTQQRKVKIRIITNK